MSISRHDTTVRGLWRALLTCFAVAMTVAVLPGGQRIASADRLQPSPPPTALRQDRSEPRLTWPLRPPRPPTRPFHAPPHPYGSGHRGVDLPGTPGEAVYAAARGSVVFAGRVVDRDVVSVEHDDGLRTTYEPVAPAVRRGMRVRAGERIGLLEAGHPGCPAAACLHWGLRRSEVYLNPLLGLAPLRVRLLPMAGGGD